MSAPYKRKIYQKLLDWKAEGGKTALMLEGARRTGKSTIAGIFARNEYNSHIIIDFNTASEEVLSAFHHHLADLDTFFMILSSEYRTRLEPRKSLIVFDEVQKFPKAREAVKYLVKDGRYDYLETGSLISIRENVQDISIPSEEETLQMYPMDFEEFCWAMGESPMIDYIRQCFSTEIPLGAGMHKKAMLLFRQYLIVGGMPKVVDAYLSANRDFFEAEKEKRRILRLYRNDIMKIDARYRSRVLGIFDQIPSLLARQDKRVVLRELEKGASYAVYEDTFFWLQDSMMTNECFNCSDPNVGLRLNEERRFIKCYMGDTGLLLTHTFHESELADGNLFNEILLKKLSLNEGMFFENAVQQALVASGHRTFFYVHYNDVKHRNDIEIDFLFSNKSKVNHKIFPVEVKSTDRYTLTSLEAFRKKFSKRIGMSYVIHTKGYGKTDGIIFLPAYMAFCV
ncbi:MAG: AAA family ATPase [Bacteroides sp.]|nr:AAA family ATPase [Bacteroides sp.]MCM1555855.1 AAA family ATPase [Bacteroides sp.]